MDQLRSYHTFTAQRAQDAPVGVHQFVISTDDLARDGAIIEAKGWKFDNFRKNPVVLYQHDDFHTAPIGRVVDDSLGTRAGKLSATIQFDMDDDVAARIEGKVARGYMSATSVRWLPIKAEMQEREIDGETREVYVFQEQELLEVSIVSIPADPGALIKRSDGEPLDIAALLTPPPDVIDLRGDPYHTDPDPLTTVTASFRALDEQLSPAAFDRLDDQERELATRLYARLGGLLADAPEAPAPPDLLPLADGIRAITDSVTALAERPPIDIARLVDERIAARTGRA